MVQSVPWAKHVFQPKQRMVGDIEPKHVAFVSEQGHLVPLVDLRHRHRNAERTEAALGLVTEGSEQGVLADRLVRLMSTYWSTAVSWTATKARRRCFISSKAPALMSDSITRLLQTTAGTLAMKSLKSR